MTHVSNGWRAIIEIPVSHAPRTSVVPVLEGATVHRFANPAQFMKLARPLTPVCIVTGLSLALIGIYAGLFLTPPDYLQGESVRVMYVQDRKSTRLNSSHT